jgi:exonuclease SbcC
MILSELQIRDYKQFAGEYTLPLEPHGVVGVVGPNGAGKTTLFESIEWCLYGPRSIATGDVFPRGREGKPRVCITLEHPETGECYIVEREIRGKTMRASVWREDRPEEILATGSAPVRAYVAEKLIGLGHDAFVSTFFTRQKELSFFGSLRPTERRVMVGRLIGVEAVRLAQETIGLDRSQAAQRAEGLAAQAEHEQQGRDLAAEIASAEERTQQATELADLRNAELAIAREALERAERAAETVRAREQRDRELAEALAVPERRRGVLEAEIEGIERDITRLQQEQARRDSLLAVAELQPARAETVARWTAERERKQRLDSLVQRQDRQRQEAATIATAARRLVTESASPSNPEWQWVNTGDVVVEIERVLAIAAKLDHATAQAQAQQLERLLDRCRDLAQAETELKKYLTRLEAIEREERTLLKAGEPALAIKRIEQRMLELRSAEQRAAANAAQAEQLRSELQPLIAHLKSHELGVRCPTCGRDIAEGEAVTVIATLEAQAQGWIEQEREHRRAAAKAAESLATEQQALTAEQTRLEELAKLRTRLESGRQYIAEKRKEVGVLSSEVDALLKRSHRAAPPAQEEVDTAKAHASALASIAQAALALKQRLAQYQQSEEAAAAIAGEIAAIGTVRYDEAAHRQATAELDASSNALATLAQIDRDLARLPALHAGREAKQCELTEVIAAHTEIARQRAEHGFSPSESVAAREAVVAATRQERTATTALHDAQTALRDRVNESSALKRERARLEELLDRSIALRREADGLDRMYREFAAFDQFVAQRITPRLAEQTSELLGYATDGKYDRVEFDENYGIHVFDGLEEKFALEGFSGGERDVVALCARLALSQVIASAAANPPSFLVLDEVFGALDRDRRAQLLELLGQLSEQTGQFQQLFVISHVDDVRSSPIFTRVWRIVETDDGISKIEDATLQGAGFEE